MKWGDSISKCVQFVRSCWIVCDERDWDPVTLMLRIEGTAMI